MELRDFAEQVLFATTLRQNWFMAQMAWAARATRCRRRWSHGSRHRWRDQTRRAGCWRSAVHRRRARFSRCRVRARGPRRARLQAGLPGWRRAWQYALLLRLEPLLFAAFHYPDAVRRGQILRHRAAQIPAGLAHLDRTFSRRSLSSAWVVRNRFAASSVLPMWSRMCCFWFSPLRRWMSRIPKP